MGLFSVFLSGPPSIAGGARRWPRKPAVFPCFWLESGYIPRHLTRKHGSQRPSGGSRAI